MQSIDRKARGVLSGRRDYDFVHKSAVGSEGGIIVAWNRRSLEVLESRIGDFWCPYCAELRVIISCGPLQEFMVPVPTRHLG